jgi:threonine synthase
MVKDEAQNPTGSFKARGMAVAVARSLELGADHLCLPSNGNAGGAAAAYGALHGVDVHVAVPANTPKGLISEIEAFGAGITLVDGSIADAANVLREGAVENGWFSVATLGEPYRVEGKKMMGYEIFWDLGHLPDVIIYPTGGGTGLVGMVKAFDEMEALGWIGSERPRMVAAQTEGCAPIVSAFHDDRDEAGTWADPKETAAFGLRVPSALGDRLMLEGLRRTSGTAVAVDEAALVAATERLAASSGIWGSPEVGVCVGAFDELARTRWIGPRDEVVLFNTGAASKYGSSSPALLASPS